MQADKRRTSQPTQMRVMQCRSSVQRADHVAMRSVEPGSVYAGLSVSRQRGPWCGVVWWVGCLVGGWMD